VATVRSITQDALMEIGVLAPGESLSNAQGATGLSWIIRMIDAWGADFLTFAYQLRTTFTLTSGSSSVSVGPGQTVNIPRPMRINTVNYLIPATSPGVEVPIGLMDQDAYANLSIKSQSSAYPIQAFYQVDMVDAFGTLFFWPEVSQDLTIALYTPQAVAVPTSLDTDIIGPPGYLQALHYQLAVQLCTPFGVQPPPALATLATEAFATMKRPNEKPGLLGTDPALIPSLGGGYNILSDQMTASQAR